MKKTYISPLLTLIRVQVENMIALSMTETQANKNSEVLVKDENCQVQGYNVWDDDWSN